MGGTIWLGLSVPHCPPGRSIEEIALSVADRILATEPVQSLLEAESNVLSPLVKPVQTEDLLKGAPGSRRGVCFVDAPALASASLVEVGGLKRACTACVTGGNCLSALECVRLERPTAGRYPGNRMEHLEWQGATALAPAHFAGLR